MPYLLAALCPPLYCAIARRWPSCALTAMFSPAAAWGVWVGISEWPWIQGTVGGVVPGTLFWLFCVAVALSDRQPRLRALKYPLLVAGVIALVLFSPDVGLKAILAHDQGTVNAMRQAIAIYYGKHGSFPEHPGRYVSPSPPPFVCAKFEYSYDSATGLLKIVSSNTPKDCER